MNETNDLLADLGKWRERLGSSARAEVVLLTRAIDEISRLRDEISAQNSSETIESEDLNASNDE